MPEVELISAEVCPFAQRTRLALMEKGVPFALTEIDLEAKPGWFLEVSPYDKVPVLRCDDQVVWESAVINEYIEEVFPEPALLPRDPYGRALARIWIDFANVTFVPLFYKLLLEPWSRIRRAGASSPTGCGRGSCSWKPRGWPRPAAGRRTRPTGWGRSWASST
jgi:glutathione S-transferase